MGGALAILELMALLAFLVTVVIELMVEPEPFKMTLKFLSNMKHRLLTSFLFAFTLFFGIAPQAGAQPKLPPIVGINSTVELEIGNEYRFSPDMFGDSRFLDDKTAIVIFNGKELTVHGQYNDAGEFIGILQDLDQVREVVDEAVREANSKETDSIWKWLLAFGLALFKIAGIGGLTSLATIIARTWKRTAGLFRRIPKNRTLLLLIALLVATAWTVIGTGWASLTYEVVAGKFVVCFVMAEVVYHTVIRKFIKTPKPEDLMPA